MKTIQLAHGGGGRLSQELLAFIAEALGPSLASMGEDSGSFELPGKPCAMTTDSFIVSPLFFPGGDIGKLAICGTINDLVMVGARPIYLSLALILEEGFPLAEMARILGSIAEEARRNGVRIIAGDTKVGARGDLDRIFINTTGLGQKDTKQEIGAGQARPGDRVIVTGTIGDHGGVIVALRNKISLSHLRSDCQSLLGLLDIVPRHAIHAMRDPTRGGVASVLNEIAGASRVCIIVHEDSLPIHQDVQGICDILGLDPLYLACEGRALIVCPPEQSDPLLAALRAHEQFAGSRVIGEVSAGPADPRVLLQTSIGTRRILPLLAQEQTPRIC